MIRWTIQRFVNSGQEAETIVWATLAARKVMLVEMAALGQTIAPSLRTLADEQISFYFVRDPADPDHNYVRVVAEHAEPPGLSA